MTEYCGIFLNHTFLNDIDINIYNDFNLSVGLNFWK